MSPRLHAVLDGPVDAPVLVLGSSLGTTSEMWRPQVGPLSERFRVVRYDHLGHGGSAGPTGRTTIDILGTELLRLLDDLALPRVSYAGLSLGGMVGMWLAAHAPDRVDRLALLCTAARLGPERAWRDRAGTVREGGVEAVAEAVLSRWFTPDFAAAHPAVVAGYRGMLTSTPAAGYAACCEAIAAMDLRADLPGIVAPTLVVAGADDPATPVEQAREIARLVPAARLAVVDRAAHLANVERPEPVTRLLLEHFEPTRVDAAGTGSGQERVDG
ncbi:3-oxoadipate enol-lactonase [Solwaraspora sp. WMMD1047]|uniref:3-oxoadipate enol-lactonase n=1 Tax=Solwaraspora sp. WMMD1047 TaxID=3016102 RepID=UPI00241597D0|nr:3-oxoadipate enol-lactonase [Solwaraspora sp. WMMD1047]MDG4831362.1 3-oxoadipate enol-lactonase [Solwaraspora sp. WMMD1047]